jgi:hypothetical protein
MRLLSVIAVALFFAGGPALAWEESIYLDQGVAIQFPVKPQTARAAYPSVLSKGLASTIYSAEDDHVIYRLTVVDVRNVPDKGASFLNEAAYERQRLGTLLFTDFPRVYLNERAVFGTTLVVDRTDGNRVRSTMYYTKGRLYIAEAIVLAARGDKDMIIPSRFDQTIRFPPDGQFD